MLEMECLQGLFSKTINITMEKLYIELTNRCNLKCAHCYNDSNNGICFDLPFDNITDMLEYAKECKLKSIALSGGEALLYPHISDVFEKCKELELDVLLLTNGTYFENEKYFNILLNTYRIYKLVLMVLMQIAMIKLEVPVILNELFPLLKDLKNIIIQGELL